MIWTGFILVSRYSDRGALTSFDLVALRFGISGLLLAPLLWLRRDHLPTAPRFLVLVLSGGVGYACVVYAAFHLAPAAHGGVLLPGLMPFLTALFAVWLLGERQTPRKRVALLIIALGVACLAFETLRKPAGSLVWLGDLLFITASASWSLFTVLLRRWQIRPWDAAACVSVGSMVLYLPIYLLFLPKGLAQAAPSEFLLQGAYQGFLAVIVAMVLFTRAVAELGPTRMGVFMAAIPVMSALLAVPLLGEPLVGLVPLGIVLVTAGAIFGATAHRRPAGA
jgi:drug/metabolite transporter (DMT)-like permease